MAFFMIILVRVESPRPHQNDTCEFGGLKFGDATSAGKHQFGAFLDAQQNHVHITSQETNLSHIHTAAEARKKGATSPSSPAADHPFSLGFGQIFPFENGFF